VEETKEPALSFEKVSFQYDTDDYAMFRDLSFSVEKGAFTALIGPSGSGKTTIFRLINRFLTPGAGVIRVNGKDVRESREECGYMPQRELLFPWRTVEANIMLPLEIRKIPKDRRQETARELLQRVGLSDCWGKYPRELSGGMRQRAAFARTLATGAGLLLLDEPFSALDSITRVSMQEWLYDQWLQMDRTILFITHDVEEALFLSQRILVLTGRPVTEMKSVTVPLPRERSREMLRQPEMQNLKNRLLDLLRQEAKP
jgi:putative hydroxymethylpyrimidine transport system ATP-binding protein